MRAGLSMLLCLLLGGCLANTRPAEPYDPGRGQSTYLLPRYGLDQDRHETVDRAEFDHEYRALYRFRGLTDRQAANEAVAKGMRQLESGHADEAMRQFNLGWLADAEAAGPYHGMALVLILRGRPPAEVLYYFDLGLGKKDATTPMLIDEARYLAGIGRPSQAYDTLLNALAEDPHAHNVARELETLSIAAGDQAGICRWGRMAAQNHDDKLSAPDFLAANCGS